MSPFLKPGLSFTLLSQRDFEDPQFLDGLLDIFLDAPPFLRPERYGRFEPIDRLIGENPKPELRSALKSIYDHSDQVTEREGVLLLEFARKGGYMVSWTKCNPPGFQWVSGHAMFETFETDGEKLVEFIDLFYRLAEHISPVYGSVNSMMTEGWHIPYDLTKRLPNVPWLLLFGAPYVDLFGRDRILTAPFHTIDELPSGLIAGKLTSTPFEPLIEEQRASVRAHLGRDCFMEGTKSTKLYTTGRAPRFDFGTQ